MSFLYTNQGKAKIVELFHQNSGRIASVQIEWRKRHGKPAKFPSKQSVHRLVDQFSASGSIKRQKYEKIVVEAYLIRFHLKNECEIEFSNFQVKSNQISLHDDFFIFLPFYTTRCRKLIDESMESLF